VILFFAVKNKEYKLNTRIETMTKLTKDFTASCNPDYLAASLRLVTADTRYGIAPRVREDFAMVKSRAPLNPKVAEYAARVEAAAGVPKAAPARCKPAAHKM
jgi:hypothetical protein